MANLDEARRTGGRAALEAFAANRHHGDQHVVRSVVNAYLDHVDAAVIVDHLAQVVADTMRTRLAEEANRALDDLANSAGATAHDLEEATLELLADVARDAARRSSAATLVALRLDGYTRAQEPAHA